MYSDTVYCDSPRLVDTGSTQTRHLGHGGHLRKPDVFPVDLRRSHPQQAVASLDIFNCRCSSFLSRSLYAVDPILERVRILSNPVYESNSATVFLLAELLIHGGFSKSQSLFERVWLKVPGTYERLATIRIQIR